MSHLAFPSTANLRSTVWRLGVTLVLSSLLAATAGGADEVPAFAGRTPGVSRSITVPTIDISGETERHVFVARGTEEIDPQAVLVVCTLTRL